jgi:hypothetical protein
MRRNWIHQLEPDGMVRMLAGQFHWQGCPGAASMPGYVTPLRVNGGVPDVLAHRNRETVTAELETSTSFQTFQTFQTFQEFRAFSSFTASYSGVRFHAAIPKPNLEAASRLALWNVSPTKRWSI